MTDNAISFWALIISGLAFVTSLGAIKHAKVANQIAQEVYDLSKKTTDYDYAPQIAIRDEKGGGATYIEKNSSNGFNAKY